MFFWGFLSVQEAANTGGGFPAGREAAESIWAGIDQGSGADSIVWGDAGQAG